MRARLSTIEQIIKQGELKEYSNSYERRPAIKFDSAKIESNQNGKVIVSLVNGKTHGQFAQWAGRDNLEVKELVFELVESGSLRGEEV